MVEYHKSFFSRNVQLLKISGLWSFYNEDKNTKVLHLALTIFYIVLCQIYRTFINFYDSRHVYNQLELFINHLGMVLSHFLGDLKVVFMFMYRKRVLTLIKKLESEGFEYENAEGYVPQEIANQEKKTLENTLLVFFMLCNSVPFTGCVPPVINLLNYSSGNKTCQEILPYPVSVPFPTDSCVSCILALIIQAVPVVIFGWQIAAVDSLYLTALVCLKSHILIINGAFRTIRSRALANLSWPQDHDVLMESESKDLIDLMDADMRRLTIHLQSVITLFEEVELVFNLIVLFQVLVMVLLGVCSLYMMSTLEVASTAFVQQLFYFVAVSFQVTLYCWLGNEITLAGASVPTAIYSVEWFSASPNFKRGMLINMLRMNKNLFVTIGKFSPLTISTLVAIFRGSYSYFAVLHNSNNNE